MRRGSRRPLDPVASSCLSALLPRRPLPGPTMLAGRAVPDVLEVPRRARAIRGVHISGTSCRSNGLSDSPLNPCIWTGAHESSAHGDRAKVAIVDEADDLKRGGGQRLPEDAGRAPAGLGADPDRHLGRAPARHDQLALPGRPLRPLPEPELMALLREQGVASDPPRPRGWPGWGEGSAPRAGAGRPRASSTSPRPNRRAGRHPGLRFRPAWRSAGAFVKDGGKESVDQRDPRGALDRRAGPLLPRHPLADRRPGHPPAPTPATASAVEALAVRSTPRRSSS